MSLVSPAIVSPITVVGVKQVDVLVIITGQELYTDKKGSKSPYFMSLYVNKDEMKTNQLIQISSAKLLILENRYSLDSIQSTGSEPDLTAVLQRREQTNAFY